MFLIQKKWQLIFIIQLETVKDNSIEIFIFGRRKNKLYVFWFKSISWDFMWECWVGLPPLTCNFVLLLSRAPLYVPKRKILISIYYSYIRNISLNYFENSQGISRIKKCLISMCKPRILLSIRINPIYTWIW